MMKSKGPTPPSCLSTANGVLSEGQSHRPNGAAVWADPRQSGGHLFPKMTSTLLSLQARRAW